MEFWQASLCVWQTIYLSCAIAMEVQGAWRALLP